MFSTFSFAEHFHIGALLLFTIWFQERDRWQSIIFGLYKHYVSLCPSINAHIFVAKQPFLFSSQNPSTQSSLKQHIEATGSLLISSYYGSFTRTTMLIFCNSSSPPPDYQWASVLELPLELRTCPLLSDLWNSNILVSLSLLQTAPSLLFTLYSIAFSELPFPTMYFPCLWVSDHAAVYISNVSQRLVCGRLGPQCSSIQRCGFEKVIVSWKRF